MSNRRPQHSKAFLRVRSECLEIRNRKMIVFCPENVLLSGVKKPQKEHNIVKLFGAETWLVLPWKCYYNAKSRTDVKKTAKRTQHCEAFRSRNRIGFALKCFYNAKSGEQVWKKPRKEHTQKRTQHSEAFRSRNMIGFALNMFL